MQFIQTLFLAGILTIAVPIIIHFLKSDKTQELWLGTLKFLEQAVKIQHRKKSWDEILLLILRILMIIALVALFARPFDYKTSVFNPEQQATVIMIDVSGSMSGKSGAKDMFEQALEKAENIKSDPLYKGEIILAVFADEVKEISTLDSVGTVTACATNYTKALEWGQNRLMQTNKKYMRLVLISDCQKSGLMDIQNLNWSPMVTLHVEQILPAAEINTGINLITGSPFVLDKTAQLKVKWNTPDSVYHKNMQWFVNGKKQQITIEKNTIFWMVNQKNWFNGQMVWEGDDAYPFDNQYFYKGYTRIQGMVNLISGKSGNSRYNNSTYFIEKALTVADNADRSLLVNVNNSFPVELGNLLIFCDGGKMSTQEQSKAKSFLEQGGSILFFLGSNSKKEEINSLYEAGVFPAKLDYINKALPQPLVYWNLNHPALGLFKSRLGGGLSTIIFEKHFQFQDYSKDQIIAAYEDGTPAILEKKTGKGRVIMVSNPVNRDWGDWSIGRLFVPIVQELVNYLLQKDETVARHENTSCSILAYPSPGIYNNLVVNADYSEQNISTLNIEQFKEAIGISSYDQPKIGINEIIRERHPGEERLNEWWHWVGLILFGLLFIELIISYLINKS